MQILKMKLENVLLLYADEDGSMKGVSHDGVNTEFQITFNNILAFATGSPTKPPLGFIVPPALGFQTCSPYPRANTCANVIYLPLCTDGPQISFDKFVYFMTSGILNTAGFGRL